MLSLQIFRTVLWACYKPFPLADGPWPSLTVIIPAYNEGAMVEKAIESVAASDYPADLLEIICIDDGSQDDTWTHIHRPKVATPT
jgi:hyaluronan synthase